MDNVNTMDDLVRIMILFGILILLLGSLFAGGYILWNQGFLLYPFIFVFIITSIAILILIGLYKLV
jgi:hypothetical protein